MIEPVALKDFFITFFVSALMIMAGAAYALLFAWSKANPNNRIKLAAYSAYLILAASVAELTYTAHFSGYWLVISAAMLVGYFFAPIGIWHLCVKTHTGQDSTTTAEEDKL
ncbi:hypothetical protein [Methylovulum psychrotolerans]|uniref:Uncharacterized protein n=1 Tax=Methylovulum psychrotolerans TaxID=1704499 RepID=A0A2S5CIF2_9GAMM|nr:hypothetical protein [Methylovulum psychrotolerans]POZ50590.1 hypothetical protein AADEFJLK_03483 [Methylovulum psychrotolerans]